MWRNASHAQAKITAIHRKKKKKKKKDGTLQLCHVAILGSTDFLKSTVIFTPNNEIATANYVDGIRLMFNVI